MKQFIHLQRDSQPGEATPLAGNSAEKVLDDSIYGWYDLERNEECYTRAETLKAMKLYASLQGNGLREALEKIADLEKWKADRLYHDQYFICPNCARDCVHRPEDGSDECEYSCGRKLRPNS